MRLLGKDVGYDIGIRLASLTGGILSDTRIPIRMLMMKFDNEKLEMKYGGSEED